MMFRQPKRTKKCIDGGKFVFIVNVKAKGVLFLLGTIHENPHLDVDTHGFRLFNESALLLASARKTKGFTGKFHSRDKTDARMDRCCSRLCSTLEFFLAQAG